MTEYRTYSVKHVQNLEHNLKVEMGARDRFHEEIIELGVIIMSLNRRIEKLEAALLHIAEGEPGVPYSCIDKRAIALAALKGTDHE